MARRKSRKAEPGLFSRLPGSVKSIGLFALLAAIIGGIYIVRFRGCSTQDLGIMESHLEGRGTVVVVGARTLGNLVSPGAQLVDAETLPAVAEALSGRDEQALVAALEEASVETLLVASSTTDPQLMPEPTLAHLLSTYRPLERFHAIYLSQAAGLFEVTEPFSLSDRAGADLVQTARAILEGRPAPRRSELSPEVTARWPGVEVAVQIQGLRPVPRENTRSSNFVRRDYYLSRTADSLREATIAAAGRLAERWGPTGNEDREGSLAEAMSRYWVEIEVIPDVTPIELERGTLTMAAYRRHLWNAVELGVHGVVGRMSEDKRFLLPSSAVYWGRADVASYLERLARRFDLNGDGETNSDDEELFDRAPELSVERFRTAHFRELERGGEVARLRRGFVPVDEGAVSREGLREGIRAADVWLFRHLSDEGLF